MNLSNFLNKLKFHFANIFEYFMFYFLFLEIFVFFLHYFPTRMIVKRILCLSNHNFIVFVHWISQSCVKFIEWGNIRSNIDNIFTLLLNFDIFKPSNSFCCWFYYFECCSKIRYFFNDIFYFSYLTTIFIED